MAYTTIDDPEAYFQVKTYTGTGSSNAQTFDGDTDMQPDLIWIKTRTESNQHFVRDAVRGDAWIETNRTVAESDGSAALSTTLDSDGFTVSGTSGMINKDTENFVAWCWKAGTAFSNDASATSVGTQDSEGDTSQTAGFSIVKRVGTGSAGASYAHNLGGKPDVILNKGLNTNEWYSYFQVIGDGTHWMNIDDTTAATDDANMWNDTAPTSAIFTVGNSGGSNGSGVTYIAYCWRSIQGFSKFGSYVGNGDDDGRFVYTGFRPAWVMAKKSSSTGDWGIYNNKSNSYNVMDLRFKANTTAAEDESSDNNLDFLSNGFKFRSSVGWNASATYIYMAFAEAPFVNSNGVPCNAR